jgi:glycosyltransferase involved in cell wall biosynthesis
VVDDVARQREVDPHFVLVPNGPGWDRQAIRGAVDVLDRVSVVWEAVDLSLGEALNAGISATDERFIAKVDDDDHYGPHYLADALRAHGYAGAGLVGKHSYYADVDGIGDRQIRFAGHEFAYSSTLAGGTLVLDRERVGDLRFEDRSLGEDRAFIQACHRRGVSTYSADRFSFVQHRGSDNTWQLDTDRFLAGCNSIDAAAPEHEVNR